MKIQRCFAGLFPYAAVALTACGAGPSATDNVTSGEDHVGTVSQAITYYPQAVPHSNTSKRVFMHYMPWFEANGVQHGGGSRGIGYGWHWTMNNCTAQSNGLLNSVCAVDKPLIGPYSSGDPYVIEYHLLLMKYAGVDGVAIDWAGTVNVDDLPNNKDNGERLINRTADFGMKFMMIMEDRNYSRDGIDDIQNGVNDLNCLKAGGTCGNQYMGHSQYEKLNGVPNLGIFGPITLLNGWQWDNAYSGAGLYASNINHVGLWYNNDLGSKSDGSYAWLWSGQGDAQGSNSSWNMIDHEQAYANNVPAPTGNGIKMASVFPGHDPYYLRGGVTSDAGNFYYSWSTSTIDQTFDISLNSNANYVQLVTFNDFGEDTVFEPTVGRNYAGLVEVQKKLGAPYEVTQLQLIKRLFDARVTARKNNDSTRQAQLDQASAYLAQRDVSAAQCIIDGCPVTGASSPLTVGGNYEIMNTNSGTCLDLPGGSTAEGVGYQLYSCNQSNAQRFALWGGPNGTYYIENIGDWKCLDASSGWNVQQKSCTWSSSQQFYIDDLGNGKKQIRSASVNNYCLGNSNGADNTPDYLWGCGSSYQTWVLRGVTGYLRHVAANMCVHPLGGSTAPADNTTSVLWNDCTAGDRIRYSLRNDGNLQQVSSGECLNAFTGVPKAADQTPLVFFNQSSCGNPGNAFRQLPNGAMQHKQTGLCLQRKNGTTNNGEPIIFGTNCAVPFSLDP